MIILDHSMTKNSYEESDEKSYVDDIDKSVANEILICFVCAQVNAHA